MVVLIGGFCVDGGASGLGVCSAGIDGDGGSGKGRDAVKSDVGAVDSGRSYLRDHWAVYFALRQAEAESAGDGYLNG